MAKHLIKRFIPSHETVRNHKHLKIFGALLHDPNLWHLNRRSAAGAFAIGLFMAFAPVPFQMLLAAGAAILFRVNLPLSIALVWITNPITMPALFYFAYLTGTIFVGHPATEFNFDLSGGHLLEELNGVWAPFLLGCFVCGSLSAVVAYCAIRALWRWHVIQHLKKRRMRRSATASNAPPQPH
jgi:uncharacterized protein (DUF2062 family)